MHTDGPTNTENLMDRFGEDEDGMDDYGYGGPGYDPEFDDAVGEDDFEDSGEPYSMEPGEFLDFVSSNVGDVGTEDLRQARYSVQLQHEKTIKAGDDEASAFFNHFHNILSGELADRLGVASLSHADKEEVLPQDVLYYQAHAGEGIDRETHFDLFSSMAHDHSPEALAIKFVDHAKEWKNHARTTYMNTGVHDSDESEKSGKSKAVVLIVGPSMEAERRFVQREFDYQKILEEHDFLTFQYIATVFMQRLIAQGKIEVDNDSVALLAGGKGYPGEYNKNLATGVQRILRKQVYDWYSGIDFAILRGLFMEMHHWGSRKSLARGVREDDAVYGRGGRDAYYDPRDQEADMGSVVFDTERARDTFTKKSEEKREAWATIMRNHIKTEKKLIDWVMTKTKDVSSLSVVSDYEISEDWFAKSEDYDAYLGVKKELVEDIADEVAAFWTCVICYSLGEKDEVGRRTEILKEHWVAHVETIIKFLGYMVANGVWTPDHAQFAMGSKAMHGSGKHMGEVLNDMLYLDLGVPVTKARIISLYHNVFGTRTQ